MAVVYDLIVDCLFEESLRATLQALGAGKLLTDPDDPEEPLLSPEEGYLVVRLKDRDPYVFARELERRVIGLRIVDLAHRAGEPTDPSASAPPGSARAQRNARLIS